MMKRRKFFGSFFGLGAAAAIVTQKAVEARTDASIPTPVITAPQAVQSETEWIKWPCMQCSGKNRTATIVWESIRFDLRCGVCGRRQSYGLWLKRYDPNPVNYSGSGFQNSVLAGITPAPRAPFVARSKAERLKDDIRARLKRGYKKPNIPA